MTVHGVGGGDDGYVFVEIKIKNISRKLMVSLGTLSTNHERADAIFGCSTNT